jgi:hypothetical protein
VTLTGHAATPQTVGNSQPIVSFEYRVALLLRLSASVKHGWDSATAALDRFGSAAAGNPVYNAGEALGRLLRTLYEGIASVVI